MDDIYYKTSHPASFGSVKDLAKNIKKSETQTKKWLMKQRTYTLHKPARKNPKKFRKYRVPFFGYQYQADLMDMQNMIDKRKKYILIVIDIFSRYAWAIPIISKEPKNVMNAFKKIKPLPIYLQVDQGLEFYGKIFRDFCKEKNIKLFSVYSKYKAAIVERLIKTLRMKMYKYFTHKNTKKWVDKLPEFLESYNNRIHSTIKMKPVDAIKSKNNMVVWKKHEKDELIKKPKFKIGDYVRISKHKKLFEKGATANWSEEIFEIKSIDKKHSPIMYVIKTIDNNNETIQGKFYNEELQRVFLPDVFPIEKIYKQKNKKHLVKFLGYPDKYWVSKITHE